MHISNLNQGYKPRLRYSTSILTCTVAPDLLTLAFATDTRGTDTRGKWLAFYKSLYLFSFFVNFSNFKHQIMIFLEKKCLTIHKAAEILIHY